MFPENGTGEYVEVVEPRTCLVEPFGDELRRERTVECLFVFERIVPLAVRHRTRIEPCVEHVWHAPHHAATLRARERNLIEYMLVWVIHLPPIHLFELRRRAEYPFCFALFAHPNRQYRGPETLTADRPVTRTLEPLAPAPLLYMCRRPVDGTCALEKRVLDLRDCDEPARRRVIEEWRLTPPTMRIRVGDVFFRKERAMLLEIFEDGDVGRKAHLVVFALRLYLPPRGIPDFFFERAVRIHVLHKRKVLFLQELPVIGTERRRFVRDSRTSIGGNEIRGIDFPSVLAVLQHRVVHVIVEWRGIFLSYQFAPFHFGNNLEVA